MATLPAHTRNYFTRANIPFGSNNTTQNLIESYYTWALSACLLDLTALGSTGGTRHANSIWICRGSSNTAAGGAISAVGVAGTNRWGGGTFPGAFTRGNNSTSHHWMLLENIALGYELLLNFSPTASDLCFSAAKTGTFTGGSISACPVPSPTSASVQAGQAAYSGTSGGEFAMLGDTANTGFTNYVHFTTADNGEFHFEMSRVGSTIGFSAFLGLWKSTGQQAGDTNNLFVLSSDTTSSGRGVIQSNRVRAANFCASIQPNGAYKNVGGVITWNGANTEIVSSNGIDALSLAYGSYPLDIWETAPQYCRRGRLPDLYLTGNATVGSSIPDTTSQIRVLMGDIIVPFISIVPNT